jgi:hypothetical protein
MDDGGNFDFMGKKVKIHILNQYNYCLYVI